MAHRAPPPAESARALTPTADASDAGAGMISTAVGMLVVLLLLLTAVHALAHLYATSVVDGVVHDVAVEVSGAASGEPCGPAFDVALTRARGVLGAYGDRLSWSCARDGEAVVVRATGPSLALAPAATGGMLAEVEREARMRVESIGDAP